jgi:hypothetical protein
MIHNPAQIILFKLLDIEQVCLSYMLGMWQMNYSIFDIEYRYQVITIGKLYPATG